MKKILLASALSMVACSASANWVFLKQVDDFTGEDNTMSHSSEINAAIRCYSDTKDAYLLVAFNDYIGKDKAIDIEYVIDKTNRGKFSGFAENKRVHGFGDLSELFEGMKAGHNMQARVKLSNDEYSNVKFSLVGFTSQLEKMESHCKTL